MDEAEGPRGTSWPEKLQSPAWIFTEREVIQGVAHRLEKQRLLDVANDWVSRTVKAPRTRFLPVTNARIRSLSGGEELALPFVAVSKAHIALIGEPAMPSSARESAPGEVSEVAMLLDPGISVAGRLFLPTGRRISDVLNDDRDFLPLVEATVRWPGGVERRFPFVAVAKARVMRAGPTV
jgi:hypothetical protein